MKPAQRPDEDDVDADPAMTEELRAVMHPRPHRALLFTAVLVVVLGAVAWLASRTVLASLWR
ncbi:hypothetical protein HUA74_41700 [Myxococcus sp. CA051A]|uniref:Uncharacterized protein n=1 Tax=Myxococcus llanfairpwllgwyngyllgogerychwyrndrobwllllantysiliogogogochensis TaxID=2590453 RepID=A0A540X4W0_9BACT|nr:MULTISPECIES: hypothetical protein [Myxococcus]NTX05618.1 hypothetical protein [Myxococcus sp. CA040A]NTX10244.1 hypothetical protein [Myxococcus sp. CA056]NTX37552.1 hypothetical protein [Myxococcus sp. CA033]NTX52885.1 hypothetical protein [Myxococcus sp. CA039A]NTX67184.1 hypothetical protein [Myxococcus sp. CA051A]